MDIFRLIKSKVKIELYCQKNASQMKSAFQKCCHLVKLKTQYYQMYCSQKVILYMHLRLLRNIVYK